MRSLGALFRSILLGSVVAVVASAQQSNDRVLRVVLYPFIPEFKSVAYDVETAFEATLPGVRLQIVDLTDNYYSSSADKFVGTTDADVYELDSVMLADFVKGGKIRPIPSSALLPVDELLNNANAGSQLNGSRFGAAHWVCGNFLFFSARNTPLKAAKTLADVESAVGNPTHPLHQGLMVDLKGKSTLGEFYLEAAYDHFGDWNGVAGHLAAIDPTLKGDLARLIPLCDSGFCRSQSYHDDQPSIYPRQFARGNASAFVGYSESLHEVLSETAQACSSDDHCLTDQDIDVTDFPTGDSGHHQMSWVDSFVLDARCAGQCAQDAVTFISFMNRDATFKQILLHEGVAPAYLLPAKRSLYADADVLKVAHLYPKLRAIVQNAEAPTAPGLNDQLRGLGKDLDAQLPGR
jgi:thiamine pyridinylase